MPSVTLRAELLSSRSPNIIVAVSPPSRLYAVAQPRLTNSSANSAIDRPAEPLSLPGIARALSMSKTKLCSLAAAEDTTVLAMINGKRVEEAGRLLRQRGCSVAEAADQVGVHDHNYFTKIFKAYMGETPRDYQKRAQKDRAAKR